MARFELDRLFGLALTDARFFRQLREHPREAVDRFELTEPETKAVLSIAPTVSSIDDLAWQLESWMTSDVSATAEAIIEDHFADVGPVLQHPLISDDMALQPSQGNSSLLPKHPTSQIAIQDGERGICLTLNGYIPRG
jgi:hypothetical protein